MRKAYYDKALSNLEEAIYLMESAIEDFQNSQNATDDFPGTRAEIGDMVEKVKALKEKTAQIHRQAEESKFQ